MGTPLVRWLATLDADRLAEILVRRPEARAEPYPTSLTGLAVRLQERRCALAALRRLPLPALQLVMVIQAGGAPAVARERVAALIGRAPSDPDLEATLRVLAQRALVWPDGEDLRMAGPLWTAFGYPLGLGEPAARLLDRVPMNELRRVAGTLGLPPGMSRADTARAVAGVLAGPAAAGLLAQAPPATRALLDQAAVEGPLVTAPLRYAGGPRELPAGAAWAAERGLLLPDGWEHLHLPCEVGRALRGPGWRAPFDPLPPEPPTVAAPPDLVAREAAAAATGAVAALSAVLRQCAATPVALRKAGGVGVREVRRLARAAGGDEPAVRLWLGLGHAAGLLGTRDGQVLPTTAYDEWAAADPADRLAAVLRAWLSLPLADGDGSAVPLGGPGGADPTPQWRTDLLHLAVGLAPGAGLAGPEAAGAALHWWSPLAVDGAGPADALVTALWREAHLLGVLAHGAAGPLAPALLDGGGSIAAAARDLLPEPTRQALFQTDLTAVVPGLPDPALAALLDEAADRESRDGAVWRFGEASLRRALDAGRGADGLLDDLRGIAAGGALPQPLEYLIGDLARRHGTLRVRAVGCVLHTADPSVAAEVAGARALRHLRLAALAPTVLSSARPAAETLAALRAAGYAPTGEDASGAPLVERAEPVRAAPRPHLPRGHGGRPAEPGELARALVAAASAAAAAVHPAEALIFEPAAVEDEPDLLGAELAGVLANVIPLRRRDGAALRAGVALAEADPRPPAAAGVAAAVDLYAGHLDRGERRRLAAAIEQGGTVRIDYTDADGFSSTRLVEPLELDRHLLTAWCHLREDERVFALDRIDAVLPPG